MDVLITFVLALVVGWVVFILAGLIPPFAVYATVFALIAFVLVLAFGIRRPGWWK